MNQIYIKKFYILTVSITAVLFSPFFVSAAAQTYYYRSDQHTINGVSAYQLQPSNTNSALIYTYPYGCGFMFGCPATYFRTDIYRRLNTGVDVMIGSDVAQVGRSSSPGGSSQGEQRADWNAPETNLLPSDTIKIVEKIVSYANTVIAQREFIMPVLNASKIDAGNWTFYRYTFSYSPMCSPAGPRFYCEAGETYGSSAFNTRIENVSFTPYQPPAPPTPPAPCVCGIAVNQSYTSKPQSNLCPAGLLNTDPSENKPGIWTWTCSNSGNVCSPATCSTKKLTYYKEVQP